MAEGAAFGPIPERNGGVTGAKEQGRSKRWEGCTAAIVALSVVSDKLSRPGRWGG